VAQRYEAMTGIAPVFLGSACGNAGTMTTGIQPFAVGNDRFRIIANGVPTGSLPFIALGFPGGTLRSGEAQHQQTHVPDQSVLADQFVDEPDHLDPQLDVRRQQ